MTKFRDAVIAEIERLEGELARLKAERDRINAYLGTVSANAPAPKPAKAKVAKKPAKAKAPTKTKGWPKGMPRDAEKRAEWFQTDAGKAYLAENPGRG